MSTQTGAGQGLVSPQQNPDSSSETVASATTPKTITTALETIQRLAHEAADKQVTKISIIEMSGRTFTKASKEDVAYSGKTLKAKRQQAYDLIYLEMLCQEIHKLSRKRRRRIATANSKGGVGKTPVAAHLALVLNWIIDQIVALIDVNENDGTTAQQVGIDREKTATLQFAIEHPEFFRSTSSILEQLASPFGYAVPVLSSERRPDHTTPEMDVLHALLRMFIHLAHSMVMDCGNGIARPYNMAAVGSSTTLVFAALKGDSYSFERLLSTMHFYAHNNDNEHFNLVRRSFIVINATSPDDTVDKFMDLLRHTAMTTQIGADISVRLEDLGIEAERVRMIPFDQRIKDRDPAKHNLLNDATLLAYVELLFAIFFQDVDHDVVDPDSINFTTDGAEIRTKLGLEDVENIDFVPDPTKTDADNLLAYVAALLDKAKPNPAHASSTTTPGPTPAAPVTAPPSSAPTGWINPSSHATNGEGSQPVRSTS